MNGRLLFRPVLFGLYRNELPAPRQRGWDAQTGWTGAKRTKEQAAELLALGGPRAISALQAFKYMNDDSAFRFHDGFEEGEPSCAETAFMV